MKSRPALYTRGAPMRLKAPKEVNTMTRLMVLGALLAVAAVADDDDRRRGGYGDRGGYGYRGGTGYRNGGPVTAALRDLREIYSRARVDDHERDHFRKAMNALEEFDERARRGRFEGKYLDRALDNMSHLAEARQLHPRAREVVRMRMRDLERLGSNGYRY